MSRISASIATLIRLKYLNGLQEADDLLCKSHGGHEVGDDSDFQ